MYQSLLESVPMLKTLEVSVCFVVITAWIVHAFFKDFLSGTITRICAYNNGDRFFLRGPSFMLPKFVFVE